ncbi:MAG TPA: hypothetical protein VIN60_00185 [Anaerolineales bacterium]
MTFPAANMRLRHILMSFLAICRNLNAPLKPGGQWTAYGSVQLQKLTSIRL